MQGNFRLIAFLQGHDTTHSTHSIGFSLAEAVNTFAASHGQNPRQAYDQLQAQHLQLRQSAVLKTRAFDIEQQPDTSLEEVQEEDLRVPFSLP